MTPDKNTCDNCRYWFQWPLDENGECRRYAPRPLVSGGEHQDTWWARTHMDDWCGEHSWRPE